jgi:electron transfer flavoprotein beta subunit
MPSLKRRLFAKRAEIKNLSASDLDVDTALCGLSGSPTSVKRIFAPPKREGKKLSGSPEEVVRELLSELRDRKIV